MAGVEFCLLRNGFWCYNAAMVYKLSSNQTSSWWQIFAVVAVAYGLRVFLIAAVILYLLHPDIVVELLLNAFVLTLILTMIRAAHMLRSLKRQQQQAGDIFVTLTERGMMLETPACESKSYIPWQSVEKASVVGGMMHVALKSGMPLLLTVAGLEPERRVEMLKFCKEYAGREVPSEMLIPMPEEYRSESPLRRLSTPVSRQEDADVLMKRLHPRALWVCLLLAPVMLAAGLILVGCYLTLDEWWMAAVAVFAFYYAFRCLHAYWHPGCKLKKWIQREETVEVHLQRGHVLVNNPGKLWTLVSQSQVEGALETAHSYIYLMRSGGLFSIGKELPPPAILPVPVKKSKRGRVLALVGSLLMVPLLLGGVFMWVFQEVGHDEVDTEHILYVEELTPVTGFPGEMLEAEEYEDEEENVCWLRMVWEDGTYVFLTLPDATAPQHSCPK